MHVPILYVATRSKQKSTHALLRAGTSYHIFRRIISITSYSYKRKMKKLSLLKVQRKNIKLFSPSWKRIALQESFIDSYSGLLKTIDPFTLVGKRMNHKFEPDIERWYSGIVVDYDPISTNYQITMMVKKITASFT